MRSNFIKSNVIILCGGQGKRLGKITKKIPKPLVKLGKFPIIEHKLKNYPQLRSEYPVNEIIGAGEGN